MTIYATPPGKCEDCAGPCQPHNRTCARCDKARAATAPLEAAEATAQRRAVQTRYRCRVHPEESVSWRGTGCAACTPRKKAA